MKNIFLTLCLLLISQVVIGQNTPRLFGGREITSTGLFVGTFYERGNNKIDNWGALAGLGVYKRLFVGAYWQGGNWQEVNTIKDFEVKYRQGGLWLAYMQDIGESRFTMMHGIYAGLGNSKAEQSRPIAYVDAVEKFYVFTPEIGFGIRFLRPFAALTLHGGYHYYIDREFDDLPLGYRGFDLNRYYLKIQLRLGIF